MTSGLAYTLLLATSLAYGWPDGQDQGWHFGFIYALNPEFLCLLLSLLTFWFVFLGKFIPLCCFSFCEVRNWQRQPEKTWIKVGQFSIQFGSHFRCLEGTKPYSLYLFMMERHTFWKSCNYSISCFIYSLLFYFLWTGRRYMQYYIST